MPGIPADSNSDLDPSVRETEAELRALLKPGGSTDRVWHLVEFSAAYEEKVEKRHAIKQIEQRSKQQHAQLRSLYSRSLGLARRPQFRVAAIAAIVLMTMAITQPLTDTNVPPPHLSYTVLSEDEKVLDATQMTNLIMALSSDNANEREAAEQAVTECGPRILPMLTPLTKSNDPELCKRAQRLIERVSLRDAAPDSDPRK